MINLFKQNEGFESSTFTGELPDEIKDAVIQVEESVFKDLEDHKLMWSNGELITNPNYEEYTNSQQLLRQKNLKMSRISKLKGLLAESDYRAIKYAEGEYTESYYQPFKEQRRAWRAEINELEAELASLNN